jgi:hypothetical protein
MTGIRCSSRKESKFARPHAVANGTPGALRLPYQPVAPGFKELTPFCPGA